MVTLLKLAIALFPSSACLVLAAAPDSHRCESKPQAAELRRVEVHLLKPVGEIVGMPWPENSQGGPRSHSLSEPCDLTVHLPDGRKLSMRTRPLLIVSRILPSDVVGSIFAAPIGGRGSIREKAAEAEQLLAAWGIESDEAMAAGLQDWKEQNYGGSGVGGRLRVGMELGDKTWLSFRASSGGPLHGGWNLVVEVGAKAEVIKEARLQASNAGITKPATRPSSEG